MWAVQTQQDFLRLTWYVNLDPEACSRSRARPTKVSDRNARAIPAKRGSHTQRRMFTD